MPSNRFWLKHEFPRRNPDGSTSIYCAKCGREVMRSHTPRIRSVSKCALCVLKASGVEMPPGKQAEDYILAQYLIPGPDKPPVPIDLDDSIAAGVLMLYPEERMATEGPIPQVGGIIGTIRSVFRTIVPWKPKDEAPPPSKQIAKDLKQEARGGGLFGPNKSR